MRSNHTDSNIQDTTTHSIANPITNESISQNNDNLQQQQQQHIKKESEHNNHYVEQDQDNNHNIQQHTTQELIDNLHSHIKQEYNNQNTDSNISNNHTNNQTDDSDNENAAIKQEQDEQLQQQQHEQQKHHPTDDQLIESINDIVSTSDLSITTAKQIRRQLESQYNIDLTERKDWLNDEIMKCINAMNGEEDDNTDDDDNDNNYDNNNNTIEISQEEQDRIYAESLSNELNNLSRPRRGAAIDANRKSAKQRQFQDRMERLKEKRKLDSNNNTNSNSKPKKAKNMWISPALQDVIGSEPMSRGDCVKQLWIYIKQHNLQNPNRKSEILLDDKLKNVFDNRKSVTMFSMNKFLTKHVKNLDQ